MGFLELVGFGWSWGVEGEVIRMQGNLVGYCIIVNSLYAAAPPANPLNYHVPTSCYCSIRFSEECCLTIQQVGLRDASVNHR